MPPHSREKRTEQIKNQRSVYFQDSMLVYWINVIIGELCIDIRNCKDLLVPSSTPASDYINAILEYLLRNKIKEIKRKKKQIVN